MNTKLTILLPTGAKILAQLGKDIRLARLRRNLSQWQRKTREYILIIDFYLSFWKAI